MHEIKLRRHCELPDCRKCRARGRWFRRKSWQAKKNTSAKPGRRK